MKTRTNQSQARKMLAILLGNAGEWVPMPLLAKKAGSLSPATRISDLRKEGWHIENKTEEKRGVKRSFYRISSTVPNLVKAVTEAVK